MVPLQGLWGGGGSRCGRKSARHHRIAFRRGNAYIHHRRECSVKGVATPTCLMLVLIKPSYPRSKGCHTDWFDSVVNRAEVPLIKGPQAPCFRKAGAEMSSHVLSAIGCEDVLEAHKSCKTVFEM